MRPSSLSEVIDMPAVAARLHHNKSHRKIRGFCCLSYTCVYFCREGFSGMKRRDFMMAVGASIGLTIIGSSAKSPLPRPRLLINKADPFTGLALLKTRYEAGMRPSDDIEGWALSWQLTGNKAFAEKANQCHADFRVARRQSANCCEARTCLDRGGFRGLGCEPASGPSDPTQVE